MNLLCMGQEIGVLSCKAIPVGLVTSWLRCCSNPPLLQQCLVTHFLKCYVYLFAGIELWRALKSGVSQQCPKKTEVTV